MPEALAPSLTLGWAGGKLVVVQVCLDSTWGLWSRSPDAPTSPLTRQWVVYYVLISIEDVFFVCPSVEGKKQSSELGTYPECLFIYLFIII